MVVGSAVAHAALVGVALVNFGSPSRQAPPLVLSVDLVAPPATASVPARAPASQPAPKPAPKPEAAPVPKPPPPTPKQVVLPEKPREPTPPKPEAKPKPREETFTPPEKKPEKSLEEVLAEMRDAQGEPPPTPGPTAPEPVETAAAPSPGAIGGTGAPLSPEELAWHRLVKQKLKGVWVVEPGFRTQPLETQVEVTLDAAGNLLGEPRITQRSGNPWYDDSVLRGLNKANPLPPPPEAGEWALWFRPEDSF